VLLHLLEPLPQAADRVDAPAHHHHRRRPHGQWYPRSAPHVMHIWGGGGGRKGYWRREYWGRGCTGRLGLRCGGRRPCRGAALRRASARGRAPLGRMPGVPRVPGPRFRALSRRMPAAPSSSTTRAPRSGAGSGIGRRPPTSATTHTTHTHDTTRHDTTRHTHTRHTTHTATYTHKTCTRAPTQQAGHSPPPRATKARQGKARKVHLEVGQGVGVQPGRFLELLVEELLLLAHQLHKPSVEARHHIFHLRIQALTLLLAVISVGGRGGGCLDQRGST
jgi:hypothetical protein